MEFKDLLKNKYILYIVLFLAITNVVGYLFVENYNAILLFITIGYLSTFFSKNMIINLITPIIVTNIVFSSKRTIEGMKHDVSKDKNEETNKENSKEPLKNKKPKKNTKHNKKNGFTNKTLSPAPASESQEDAATGKRIDYSATLEQAYDNLQNIIGDGGMENLTKDTKDLIKQQKSLMKTMQSMAPILKNANSILGNLDMSQMNNAMGSITSLMGKFGLNGNGNETDTQK